ncbi:MAG: GNAT family N-acetyltransferase [bacterium]|nr:GNAT family N-acetyltransferase [bacterium]
MSELTMGRPGFKAIPLQEGHLDRVLELMNKEGWYYYDHQELRRYLSLNQVCYALMKDERIRGSIFTTNYSNQAWIGNIIIEREHRGMGLAAEMIRGVVDELRMKEHIHTFRLGSVPLAIGVYKRVGFRPEAFTTAQEAELPIEFPQEEPILSGATSVEILTDADLEAVDRLDDKFFKSRRLPFLTKLYEGSLRKSCLCLKDHGRVVGFLMLRRRLLSKADGGFAEGPDHVYRLGPSCVLPEYGIDGFKALFQVAVRAVNDEVRDLGGSAKMYVVFPRDADREEIYRDTQKLAGAMGLGAPDLDGVFDEHSHIFAAQRSAKNEQQWQYMESLGFRQEYFEQVMSYTPDEAADVPPDQQKAVHTRADPEGIFASATPGDKA